MQQQQEAEQATTSQAEASQTAAAKAAVSREAAAPNAEHAIREERVERRQLSKMLRHQSIVQRRRHFIGTLYWLVSWGLVFVWAGAIAGVFYQFPETRGVADKIVAIPGLALVAWFVAGLINALATLVIDRVATAWSEEERLAGNPRESLRAYGRHRLKDLSGRSFTRARSSWFLSSCSSCRLRSYGLVRSLRSRLVLPRRIWSRTLSMEP
jgi:hypothetical protein